MLDIQLRDNWRLINEIIVKSPFKDRTAANMCYASRCTINST